MYNYFSRNAQQAYSDKLNNNLYCKTHGVKKKRKIEEYDTNFAEVCSS